ncbi:MAG: hypothetical protein ACYTKD_08180 [Planctomycetota bacterium]
MGGALVVLLVCHAGPRAAYADVVHMKDGGKIEGLVKDQGKDVVIETLGGVVKLSAKGVASINTEHVSTVEVYYEKLQSVEGSDDPWAFIELAAWAKGIGARRFVRPNMERAAELVKIPDANSVLALVERAREKGLSTGLAPSTNASSPSTRRTRPPAGRSDTGCARASGFPRRSSTPRRATSGSAASG